MTDLLRDALETLKAVEHDLRACGGHLAPDTVAMVAYARRELEEGLADKDRG